jgi:sensor histidine kinase YesM
MNIFTLNKETVEPASSKKNEGILFIQILVWALIFGLPILAMIRSGFFSWNGLFSYLPIPISFLIVFYGNYLYLTEQFLFKKKNWTFFFINIILIVGLALLLHLWHELIHNIEISKGTAIPPPNKNRIPVYVFIVRDIVTLTFIAISSVVIKTSRRLALMQEKQTELERAMTESELKNLKNQLNPHFLLNTLNNIYALSQFNSPKTSEAILELSRMLRYVLYENEKSFVLLKDEVDFIRNYIDLMKLRLTDNVTVNTRFDILEQKNTLIVPLIFISLIENAFKHGVSSDDPSVIDINLTENDNGEVHFLCRNTFFPKNESDKSGSGIGLQLVKKRLDLLYPNNYSWKTEVKDNFYSTLLVINTLNVKNDYA